MWVVAQPSRWLLLERAVFRVTSPAVVRHIDTPSPIHWHLDLVQSRLIRLGVMSRTTHAEPASCFDTSAGVFRAYLKHLETSGLREQVRAAVSPNTRTAIDRPPFILSWLPHEHFIELFKAVSALQGPDGLRTMGYEATSRNMGVLVLPIMQGITNLLGAKPSSLFADMASITSPVVRGYSFTWIPETNTSGHVEIQVRFANPDLHYLFTLWEGVMRYGFDVCRTRGVIEPHVVLPDGRTGRYRVQWQA